MRTNIQAAAFAFGGFVVFGALLFLPAGTFAYWQAWVFIAVFATVTAGPTVYWALRTPEVLQRRMQTGPTAETRPAQKFAIVGLFVVFVATLVVSAFDHRFGWSSVPTAVSVVGAALVALGLGLSMVVVQQNSYASSNITVESDQKVISTGLYGVVRHPMYFASLIMMAATPLALGSYWGLVVLIPSLAVFAVRILDEEKMLNEELDGYREYTHRVHARLVPYVW
jgi:protein-S-isoprenylcysteine O-methyltransferase Ste14